MNIQIIGKVKMTPALRDKIVSKLESLDKYSIINKETLAQVNIKINKLSQRIEITIYTRGGILRSEIEEESIYDALDKSIDVLEDQIRRQKTKLDNRHKRPLTIRKENNSVKNNIFEYY